MWDYNHYDDYLAHFGVKGMKWGVRRKRNTMPMVDKKRTKEMKKADVKWEKNVNSRDRYVEVYNAAAGKLNSRIDAFNKKWDNVDLINDKKAMDDYQLDYGKMWDKTLRETVDEMIGTSPSGDKYVHITTDGRGGLPRFTIKKKGQ